jgi:hypothetical protein
MREVALLVYTGEVKPYFLRCLDSLRQHSDCDIQLHYHDVDSLDALRAHDVRLVPLDPVRWLGRRMAHKVELALQLHDNLEEGAHVLVLDTDLLVQNDPFKVFSHPFDLCYTTRHYDYYYHVNAGVWGFRVNARSREVLMFWISQMCRPTWGPLLAFRQRFARTESLDWWVDQDFLCVVHDHGALPVQAKLFDAGYRYNYTWDNGRGAYTTPTMQELQRFKEKIGDNAYVILHLKGELKWLI